MKKELQGELYANFRDARIVELLKVEVSEGDGMHEEPIRRVVYLLTKQGKVLAKINEVKERKFAGGDEMYSY